MRYLWSRKSEEMLHLGIKNERIHFIPRPVCTIFVYQLND